MVLAMVDSLVGRKVLRKVFERADPMVQQSERAMGGGRVATKESE